MLASDDVVESACYARSYDSFLIGRFVRILLPERPGVVA